MTAVQYAAVSVDGSQPGKRRPRAGTIAERKIQCPVICTATYGSSFRSGTPSPRRPIDDNRWGRWGK
ncbi:hypothetical protein NJ7G_0275 [Natrinema sp. J7-2]|nr:hypothetical protein NJ7G_0275 [Natrinema sp. J7-2]